MTNKLQYLIIGSLILLLVSLVIIYNVTSSYLASRNTSTIPSTAPTPQRVVPTAVPLPKDMVKGQSIRNVPTLNPTSGLGLDLDSSEIQNSIAQIEKIKTKLPYKKTLTAASGVEVEILIPPYELLTNRWVLNVQIFHIDYELSEGNPNYEANRQAFLEAARDVFYWLKDNGVKTEEIIIQWGDREFIQTRSEEWLK